MCRQRFLRPLSVHSVRTPYLVQQPVLPCGKPCVTVLPEASSNEAGMGSTPHAHAIADVENPEDQGEVAMIGVFIDTFVVLTMTALVILSSGVLKR